MNPFIIHNINFSPSRSLYPWKIDMSHSQHFSLPGCPSKCSTGQDYNPRISGISLADLYHMVRILQKKVLYQRGVGARRVLYQRGVGAQRIKNRAYTLYGRIMQTKIITIRVKLFFAQAYFFMLIYNLKIPFISLKT